MCTIINLYIVHSVLLASNSIFINIKHLRTPQKRNRITRLKLEKYRISKRLHRLQIKAMDMTEHGGCTDTTINADMAIIMEELNTNISKDSLGDFERIFWEQQVQTRACMFLPRM